MTKGKPHTRLRLKDYRGRCSTVCVWRRMKNRGQPWDSFSASRHARRQDGKTGWARLRPAASSAASGAASSTPSSTASLSLAGKVAVAVPPVPPRAMDAGDKVALLPVASILVIIRPGGMLLRGTIIAKHGRSRQRRAGRVQWGGLRWLLSRWASVNDHVSQRPAAVWGRFGQGTETHAGKMTPR